MDVWFQARFKKTIAWRFAAQFRETKLMAACAHLFFAKNQIWGSRKQIRNFVLNERIKC
jgi:hypothetical protein